MTLLHKLVYYEVAENIESVILREKQLNCWQRDWKFNLINHKFSDFYYSL